MAGSQTPRGGIIEGINVTPLVDITLVLLIIFIVTAKLVVNPAVPLDLPAASSGEDLQTIFAVSIGKDGKVYVDGKELGEDAQLSAHARDALGKDKEVRAVIQADGDVSHRRVVFVLDQLKVAGLTKVAFGTVQTTEVSAPPAAPGEKAEEGASGGAE